MAWLRCVWDRPVWVFYGLPLIVFGLLVYKIHISYRMTRSMIIKCVSNIGIINHWFIWWYLYRPGWQKIANLDSTGWYIRHVSGCSFNKKVLSNCSKYYLVTVRVHKLHVGKCHLQTNMRTSYGSCMMSRINYGRFGKTQIEKPFSPNDLLIEREGVDNIKAVMCRLTLMFERNDSVWLMGDGLDWLLPAVQICLQSCQTNGYSVNVKQAPLYEKEILQIVHKFKNRLNNWREGHDKH